ncbi:MAG TPA: hypothetical protein VMT16_15430, partial [Thermoanaerobaculia bacterium]|nr:hypothetical protein [Thermoanaerobaculia bacterium]
PPPPPRAEPPPPPPAPPPPPQPTAPPRPRPPSPDHLKFLGRFGSAAQPIAVLTSGAELYNVREGDVIEGRFVIAGIGYESIDIGFVGFPDEPPKRLPVGR